MKSNGHDTSTSRVNGHGPVPPSRAAHHLDAPLETGRAASDDARDIPSAADASSASAGTERDACAEVAPPPEGGTKRGPKRARDSAAKGTPCAPSEPPKNATTATNSNAADEDNDLFNIPPGSQPLPSDGVGFVDAMHAHVDLYLACARLVKSSDEKIAQRMVERLLEMSYGKSPAASGDGAPQTLLSAPPPTED